jgi:hypothetical protein
MWINEIHYDNYGTDEGEFIEIVASASMSIASAAVTLYNGNNGSAYNDVSLSEFTQGSTQDGYTFYYYSFPSNGIQNGPPDAISLENGSVVIQFISYEGTMTAFDGAANGMSSIDIGVSEPGEIGESLQLQGIGTSYDSFSWVGPIPATMGSVNTNQILGNSGTIDGCIDPIAVNYNPAATDDDGSCLYATEMSIYDIQYTTVQGDYCYESASVGQYAITTGVVTAVVPGNPTFYIQDFTSDTYAGIYIFDNSFTPVVGDEVTISGTVNEYYSFTQLIDLTSYSVNSSGNALTVKDITTGELANGCTESGESLEGMLVRISNVEVTQVDLTYNEWYVDDGSGPCQIDDGGSSAMFDGVFPTPNVGDSFPGITGVVDYSYSEFGILPRIAIDFETDTSLPVADAGADIFVFPGGEVTLDGSNSIDQNGSIISYEWVQVSGTSVDLADEESAITTFIAPDVSEELIFRLTVYDNDINEDTDEVVVNIIGLTSIYDIQYTEDQGQYCYETPMVGEPVVTTGVVTHVKPGSNPTFFLQDPDNDSWSGIYVHDTSVNPDVGDKYELAGSVNEYYSFTQLIDITGAALLSTTNPIQPTAILASEVTFDCSLESEAYESMLVSLSNVTLQSVSDFGTWTATDGSGSTFLLDDYYYDGTDNDGDGYLDFPSSFSVGTTFDCITGIFAYSYSEFKVSPRDLEDLECQDSECVANGDVNSDQSVDILDIVQIVNYIMGNITFDENQICAANMNGDAGLNILDIVQIVNIILDGSGRIKDAQSAIINIYDDKFVINADGYIGGVQMTLSHDSNFIIHLNDNTLISDYKTLDNKTTLVVVEPKDNEIFSCIGTYKIDNIIIANSNEEINIELPKNIEISSAFPNPFNPTTQLSIELPLDSYITTKVYNLNGVMLDILSDGFYQAGLHNFSWDASSFSSGVYLLQVNTDELISTQKIMLVK